LILLQAAGRSQSVLRLGHVLGGPMFAFQHGQEICVSFKWSRPFLGPTWHPIRFVPWLFPGEKSARALFWPILSI